MSRSKVFVKFFFKKKLLTRLKSRTITNDQKGVDSSQIVKKTDIFETLKICNQTTDALFSVNLN